MFIRILLSFWNVSQTYIATNQYFNDSLILFIHQFFVGMVRKKKPNIHIGVGHSTHYDCTSHDCCTCFCVLWIRSHMGIENEKSFKIPELLIIFKSIPRKTLCIVCFGWKSNRFFRLYTQISIVYILHFFFFKCVNIETTAVNEIKLYSQLLSIDRLRDFWSFSLMT